MLSIGSSALLAYRAALNTVSQNIANANTPGYSREVTDLRNVPGINSGAGTLGMGVTVQSVQRLSSGFLQQQLVGDNSSYNRVNTFQTFAAQANTLLSGANAGLAQPLQNFFTALNTLAGQPTSSAARTAALGAAQSLTGAFNTTQQQLVALDSQIGSGISSTVTQINGYATQLAQLNSAIAQATAQGNGQPPNQLLDQRDALLQNIGSDVGISTQANADGTVNVFLASGQPLVLGASANSLSVQPDTFGQGQDIALNSAGSKTVVTPQLSGGTLGGMLDARRELVVPAMNAVGRIAAALASAVNAQNAAGVNQYGQLGGALFSAPAVAVTGAAANGGSAGVTAAVAAVGQLAPTAYVLKYDGTAWSMTRQDTGAAVALTGAGTAASPLSGGGLQLVVAGSAAAGDQFLVQPTQFAAGTLAVATVDPAAIATAAAVQTSTGGANTGSATISGATVVNASNPNLLSTSTIQFTSATTYSINGTGSYAYTSGDNITVNGAQVQISGVPAAGDSFTLSANSGASGDNGNAQALANIAGQALLDGGTNTLASANTALVTQVGAQAQNAQNQVSAQSTILSQTQAQNASISGVNLDEEAAAMMQFQQAYQAAAQVISTSNTLFQSLLSSLQNG
jgi:flagellar hook-associated protein 1 FlgK